MRVIVLALVATGCSLTPSNFPPELPLGPQFTTCAEDSDCVVVELGCCDECNGGLAVATNAQSAGQVQDTFSERCGREFGCTLIGCGPLTAECDVDTCTLGGGDL